MVWLERGRLGSMPAAEIRWVETPATAKKSSMHVKGKTDFVGIEAGRYAMERYGRRVTVLPVETGSEMMGSWNVW